MTSTWAGNIDPLKVMGIQVASLTSATFVCTLGREQ